MGTYRISYSSWYSYSTCKPLYAQSFLGTISDFAARLKLGTVFKAGYIKPSSSRGTRRKRFV